MVCTRVKERAITPGTGTGSVLTVPLTLAGELAAPTNN